MNTLRPVGSFALLLLLHQPSVLSAQQPATGGDVAVEPDLAALMVQLDHIRLLQNSYLRRDRSASLRETARSYQGRPVAVDARVYEVTDAEVVLDVYDKGRTRIVIEHHDSPTYGNLGTRRYAGGPGTHLANLTARPFALRIGSEIALDVAKQLRRDQRLTIHGTLGSVVVYNEGWIGPHVIAIVRDWTVSVSDEVPGASRAYSF